MTPFDKAHHGFLASAPLPMLAFLVRFVSLFALALWVGGGAAISFLVAPVVFEKAGSRRQAGDIVGAVLSRFDVYALVAGPIAVLTVGVEALGTVGASRMLMLKLALVTSMVGLTLFARLALTPEIRRLREAMGDALDDLPKTDPRRREFGKLHGYSILCLLGEILLGAFAIALTVMSFTAPGAAAP